MSVRATFRASVTMPIDTLTMGSLTHRRKVQQCTQGCDHAGTDFYSDIIEWAEFSTLKDAQTADRLLTNLAASYKTAARNKES